MRCNWNNWLWNLGKSCAFHSTAFEKGKQSMSVAGYSTEATSWCYSLVCKLLLQVFLKAQTFCYVHLKKSFSALNVRRKSHFYIAWFHPGVSNAAVFSEDAPIPIVFLCCDTQDIIDNVLSHTVHCMEYESKIHSIARWQEDAQVWPCCDHAVSCTKTQPAVLNPRCLRTEDQADTACTVKAHNHTHSCR